jgi:hypothetical protein
MYSMYIVNCKGKTAVAAILVLVCFKSYMTDTGIPRDKEFFFIFTISIVPVPVSFYLILASSTLSPELKMTSRAILVL